MLCRFSRSPRFSLHTPISACLVAKSVLGEKTLSAQFCSSSADSDRLKDNRIGDGKNQHEIQDYVRSHWDDSVSRNDSKVQRLKKRLAAGDRSALAESITLVESRHPTKKAQAEYLLAEVLTSAKRRYDKRGAGSLSFRVGITGSPGVGKSSFIEVFGKYLIEQHQKKVAVLTIDPSSQTTGGKLRFGWCDLVGSGIFGLRCHEVRRNGG